MVDLDSQRAETLRITEIFLSLQGEADSVGWPTVFVRLTGCPLRCAYCDTSYAFTGGQTMNLATILAQVESYGVRHVCVTGGEPLAQKSCLTLLSLLSEAGYEVSLETSGALDIAAVDPRVTKVMDIKTPGSGEAGKNLFSNISHLNRKDQVKLVLCGEDDYEWAKTIVERYQLDKICDVLFSPCFGKLPPRDLAEWIVRDRLNVRFQLQLHKILWGDEPGR